MPQEGRTLDQGHVAVADIKQFELIDASEVVLLVLILISVEVVFLAEVPEVMHSNVLTGSLPHQVDVHTFDVEEILVLTVNAAKPTVKLRRYLSHRQDPYVLW